MHILPIPIARPTERRIHCALRVAWWRVAALCLALAALPVGAAAAHLCEDLLLLGRVSARAQAAAASPAQDSARTAHAIELAVALRRFGRDQRHPPEIAALAGRILSENLLFLEAARTDPAARPWPLADWVRTAEWRSAAGALHRSLVRNECLDAAAETRATARLSDQADPSAATRLVFGTALQDVALSRLPAEAAGDWRGIALVVGLEALALVALARLLARRRFRRDSRRQVCNVPGALEGYLYCEATMLLDLSLSGCKLRLNGRFFPDRPVLIHVGNRTISARPRWSNAHYAGLRFDRRLTETEFRDILAEANRVRGDAGPPVPALPCHTETCRESCSKYLQMQRLKASRAGG